MPNWVRNKIMVGRPSTISIIKEKYCFVDEDTNELKFDFNKLIPMPDEMNIEFSSRSDHALMLYMTRICPEVDYYGKKEDKVTKKKFNELNDELGKHMMVNTNLVCSKDELKDLLTKYKDDEDFLLDLGKKEVNNVMNYGCLNWYEWAIKNWGTKWNSTNLDIDVDGKCMTFDTAWDPATPVFVELTKQMPEVKFAMLYSDEEIGCHVGYMLAHGGNVDFEGSFPDQTMDAYKLALDVWDLRDEYEIDEEKGTCTRLDDIKRSEIEMD